MAAYSTATSLFGTLVDLDPAKKKIEIGPGHNLVRKTFHKPTFCHHCTEMLWGLLKQGYSCEGKVKGQWHCYGNQQRVKSYLNFLMKQSQWTLDIVIFWIKDMLCFMEVGTVPKAVNKLNSCGTCLVICEKDISSVVENTTKLKRNAIVKWKDRVYTWCSH